MTFAFSDDTRNFRKLLSVSWEVLVLHGRWLIRNSHPSLRTLWSVVIKSPKFCARGTTLPNVFCNEPFLSWFSCALRNFGLSGWSEYGAASLPLFLDVPILDTEMCLRVCPVVPTLLHLLDFLWSPPTTLASLATGLPVPVRVSLFIFLFLVSVGSRDWFLSGELLGLRRRVVAGLDEESSVVSCGNDVGDALAVELEEPVGNPGTTIGALFSVLHLIILHCLIRCGCWQLAHSSEYLWYSQSFPNYNTASVSLRICRRTLSLPHSFALLHWLSSSAKFRSFLHWCSRIYHQFSFRGFRRRWRWWPNFSRRVECGFVLIFELMDMFRHFTCISAGALFLLQGFFLRSVHKFRSIGASECCITPCNGPSLSRVFTWRYVHFQTCTLPFGPKNCVTFREIDFDFGGSKSWNTPPKLLRILQ